MKILWVCPTSLHPTTRGGQIRTLGMLRELRRSHEIHFAALARPGDSESAAQASEYCSQIYPVPHQARATTSPVAWAQAAAGMFSRVPLAVSRWTSADLRERVRQLIAAQRFDRVVCDFLAAAPNVPALERATLFEHNLETIIWERLRDTASNPLLRMMYGYEAARMSAYENSVCNAAAQVVAVSQEDADQMRTRFGIGRVSTVPTGVDIDFFAPPPESAPVADLVFTGSMNWAANIDGMLYFASEILPLILARKPGCRVAIVGRTPPRAVTRLAELHPNISVTGTVPDMRPYVWGSKVFIVPLRIGGGTRLKIFEAMAARIPVVSTSIGAEGLPVTHGENIVLADEASTFAEACLNLLDDAAQRARFSKVGWELVATRHTWKQAAGGFERILEAAPAA